ncbi:OTU-like cysteine protease [Metarhizium robertsii]|uniref:Ubiquitin thioesterase OTU n=2 Tax=Metarhizium robertsii TaxID=568076 RepID=E9EWR9_METRA|nr:Ovarian tumor, otubain [Metarhizium robertsii ARSEF 23]EFY99539.1 Ovarian tumor, otubain [Metarhizium robertsii ARSEF 23]EXV06212.1 OTU-like cysteine protease [Metarhizium robertsii]
MRSRYKSPLGTGILEIDDSATIQMVFEALQAKTRIENFAIKYGPPTNMQSINLEHGGLLAKDLGLHGETLTIVPIELKADLATSGHARRLSGHEKRAGTAPAANTSSGDVIVPWPEREGSLLLRVMPSDNSCLFTAFGGALLKQMSAAKLRQMMAEYITEHPDVYNEAILGCSPVDYCRGIKDPDRWGGGIELSILSTIFDIQICTFDVQGQHLMTFGERKQERCILVYSGIHYDRVVFSYSDFPHNVASLPPEMDRSIWPTDDSEVLVKAKMLVEELNANHYYTDTDGLVLKCNEDGCEWIGNGQLAARKHAEATGHTQLTEIADPEEDSILRRCLREGCTFLGQGASVERHRTDTGHNDFDVIPDM